MRLPWDLVLNFLLPAFFILIMNVFFVFFLLLASSDLDRTARRNIKPGLPE
jgi:hypothetical protein